MGLVDFDALLFEPVQTIFGDDAAVLATTGSAGSITLSAIDKTAGIEVAGGIDVQTILPAAVIRMAELIGKGVSRLDLDGATLTLNGKAWLVETHRLVPGPGGEAAGECLLLLSEMAS